MIRSILTRILKPPTYITKLKPLRQISAGSKFNFKAKTYEGDGKTKIQILNIEADLGLMVNGISVMGFRLNNDVTVLGPMAIFPRTALSWNVNDIQDINEDSLSLFSILEPKLDVLVLGIGDRPDDFSFYKKLVPISRKLNITFEILPTEQACSTFNFLNSEGRCVAGAFILPKTLYVSEADRVRSNTKYRNAFKTEWSYG